jgi:hypothetical protein
MTAPQKYLLLRVKLNINKEILMNEVKKRMSELFKPIDQQIMMCDDADEILMLACIMLQSAKDILDSRLGTGGRKKIFNDYV